MWHHSRWSQHVRRNAHRLGHGIRQWHHILAPEPAAPPLHRPGSALRWPPRTVWQKDSEESGGHRASNSFTSYKQRISALLWCAPFIFSVHQICGRTPCTVYCEQAWLNNSTCCPQPDDLIWPSASTICCRSHSWMDAFMAFHHHSVNLACLFSVHL